MSLHIEYEHHDELDRSLPMVVEHTVGGGRIHYGTFKTLGAAQRVLDSLRAASCDCDFDHLCDKHYFDHFGEHREAA
jgi:hypothetical protein